MPNTPFLAMHAHRPSLQVVASTRPSGVRTPWYWVGCVMGKRHRRKSGEWYARHIRLHFWMMKSPAWCDLTPTARALLIEVYALYNGTNNGELFLSVRCAARRLAVSDNTAWKSLRELEWHGFIRAAKRGAFHLKVRHATCWILTEFEHAGQLATKDFMRWPQRVEIQKPVAKTNTNGSKNCDRGDGKEAA